MLKKILSPKVLITGIIVILAIGLGVIAAIASPSPVQHKAITAIAAMKGYDVSFDEGTTINLWGAIDIHIPGAEIAQNIDGKTRRIDITDFTLKAPLSGFINRYEFNTLSLGSAKITEGDKTTAQISQLQNSTDADQHILKIAGDAGGAPIKANLPLKVIGDTAEGADALLSIADEGRLSLTYINISLAADFKRDGGNGATLSNIALGPQNLSGTIMIDDLFDPAEIKVQKIGGKNLAATLRALDVAEPASTSETPLSFTFNGVINRTGAGQLSFDMNDFSIADSNGHGSYKKTGSGQSLNLTLEKAVIDQILPLAKIEFKNDGKGGDKGALKGQITIDEGLYKGRNIISGTFAYEDDTKRQRLTSENAVIAQSDNWQFEALNSDNEGFAFISKIRNASFKDFSVLMNMEPDFVQTGRADVEISLSADSKIKSFKPFPRSIQGKANFAISDSDIDTKLVDRFVGGLINSLFPEAGDVNKTSMSCAYMPFTINNGVATMEGGLVDTKRAQLKLKGDVFLSDEKLDIYISPEPKGLALGDLSVPVYLEGPFSDPKIKPSTLGIGKKVGGLVLGMVNPVFFAVTLTDFSLADDHPCVSSIKNADTQKNEDNQ